jgi:arylsulfatase
LSTDEFGGVIGRTTRESTPWYPERPQPPEGAPNVIYIVLDDTGFAHLGCFGSDIETPNMDRLAAGGLRYNNFHTTALCSPTRACLLTGRNHHSVGVGRITELSAGYPGYYGHATERAANIAEILRLHGYNTFLSGKWHLLPNSDTSAAGPYDHWPLSRGFDRYYGFLGGETDQWNPDLVMGNERVSPPKTPEEGYHLTEDLVDRAITFIQDQKSVAPDSPFFLYLAFGATHAPHHAPREFIDKYKGRFDDGWDAVRERVFERQKASGIVPPGTQLAPRNDGVRAWDDLNATEKRYFARTQEVFAGFLDHTDHHIGRLLDFLEDLGQFENSLIVLISDNGASQEGGPIGTPEHIYFNSLAGVPLNLTVDHLVEHIDELGGPLHHNHYPTGWEQAGNTPLKRYKQNTHGGGIRDPMIVHWPARIKDAGAIRGQYHHVVDITPTVLEVLGIEAPDTYRGVEQMPIEGTSFAYTFDEAGANTRKERQYYEMLGHRAIYEGGWKAVSFHMPGSSFDDDTWELYHIDEDFSECSDLSAEKPGKLDDLKEAWMEDAERYKVLPLADALSAFGRAGRSRRQFTYYAGKASIPTRRAPTVANRSHRITAEIERGSIAEEGVLAAHGGRHGGWSLFIKDNHLQYEANFLGLESYRAESKDELPAGPLTARVDFIKTDNFRGLVRLFVNDELAGECEVSRLGSGALGGLEPMEIGRDCQTPVSDLYECPFEFTGKLHRVEVLLAGRENVDPQTELDSLLAVE